MKDIEKVVSDNVKKLIKKYNLSHQDLATIAGVSVSTVGKWTLEKASPRMGAIQKISDHFQIPKSYILKEDEYELPSLADEYTYFPTAISAGLPLTIDGITEASKISISDEVLGRYANDKDVFFCRANGDSMNRLFTDGSLLAIKPITLDSLKNGDIVVYSYDSEYSVKHYHKYGDTLVFKPNSTTEHQEHEYNVNDRVKIYGKVITYIVNTD